MHIPALQKSKTAVFISRVEPFSDCLLRTLSLCQPRCTCRRGGRLQPALPGLCSALSVRPTQQTQSRRFQSISSWQTLSCTATHTAFTQYPDTQLLNVSQWALWTLACENQTNCGCMIQVQRDSDRSQWLSGFKDLSLIKETLMCFLLPL